MKTITYQSIDTIPSAMRSELANCNHAGEAESVFNAWASRCFVELRSRAAVWLVA